MFPIFLRDAVNYKALHKLSKLLLTQHNILLANASGQVVFYTPECFLNFGDIYHFLLGIFFKIQSDMGYWDPPPGPQWSKSRVQMELER